MTRSNSRRFVNAAWSLLTFQFIASAGAVVVTGLAATHVSTLVGNAQQAAGPVMPAEPAIEEARGVAPPADGTAPPAAGTAPAAAEAAAPATPAPADGATPAPPGPPNQGGGSFNLGADGDTLYLSQLTDPDGVSGSVQIQWVRNGVVVPGAAEMSYRMTAPDRGAEIYARATYVDGRGNNEVATSNTVRGR